MTVMNEKKNPVCCDCGKMRMATDPFYKSRFVANDPKLGRGSYVFCPACAEKRDG